MVIFHGELLVITRWYISHLDVALPLFKREHHETPPAGSYINWLGVRPGMCGQAQVKAEVRASAVMGPGGNGLLW